MLSASGILLVVLVLYLLKVALFILGARRASMPVDARWQPTVSILIAARNEERNLPQCLASLALIDYPADRLEICVIDDHSTDGTAAVIEEWKQRIPALRSFIPEAAKHGLLGKSNAIAQAVERSTGEIILTTDADCVVPPQWVRATVRQYTPEVGCVCGYTLLRDSGVFGGFQSLDWAYVLTIASAGVGWGVPLSAVGNNMSFRRAAYDDVGGYARIGFSVTEDFLLFKAISYKTAWKVRYPVAPDTLVWSEACETVKELYRQRKRWGVGGKRIHPIGFFVMAVGFLMNLALIVSPFAGVSAGAWLLAFAGKCAGDAALLAFPLGRFHRLDLYKYFFPFELYYLTYVTLLPFVVFLTGRVVWKDRKL
jgi:cellulose synthase/poly-beta-1,6-N-acetylglucosamine synthase-like glycosyltransferase